MLKESYMNTCISPTRVVVSSTVSIGQTNRLHATKSLYQIHIKPVSEVVDRMLMLLMGDDYDKSFTEEELLPYGYPDVTDEELEDRILENF